MTLLVGLFVVALALAAFALIPSQESAPVNNKRNSAPVPDVHDPLVHKLAEQTQTFDAELQNLKQEHLDLNRELELANKVVFDLKEELDKLRKMPGVDNSEFDKLRKDSSSLKEELLNKSNQLEKEISAITNSIKELKQNRESQATLENEKKALTDKISALEDKLGNYTQKLDAQKEVIQKYEKLEEQVSKKEYEEVQKKLNDELGKIDSLNKDNSDLVNKIKLLEIQSQEYNKEIEKQKSIIEKLESVSANNINKDEFEQLNEKLKLETEKLDMLKNENASLVEKINDLEFDSEKLKKEVQKQSAQAKEAKSNIDLTEFVSKKDYEALKKKLESAEEVLRIVHGAGA